MARMPVIKLGNTYVFTNKVTKLKQRGRVTRIRVYDGERYLYLNGVHGGDYLRLKRFTWRNDVSPDTTGMVMKWWKRPVGLPTGSRKFWLLHEVTGYTVVVWSTRSAEIFEVCLKKGQIHCLGNCHTVYKLEMDKHKK